MTSRLRAYFPELVLLANAGAFVVLLVELQLLQHNDGVQLVAPVTAGAGAALSVLSVVAPFRLRLVPADYRWR